MLRVRVPTWTIAAALLGVIALLGTLQYRWLGRISDAERDRMRAALNAQAAGLAEDFDRDLTLAYMVFQTEPLLESIAAPSLAVRFANRYDRWHAAARHPRLIKDYLVATHEGPGEPRLQRFDPDTRVVEPLVWPETLQELRRQMASLPEEPSAGRNAVFVRTLAGPLWDAVPAIVIPAPLLMLDGAASGRPSMAAALSYTVLVLDREYLIREMIPALARRHFPAGADGLGYALAILRADGDEVVYRSGPERSGTGDPDATAELFRLRVQEFQDVAAHVRRFAGTPEGGSVSSAGAAPGSLAVVVESAGAPRETFVARSIAPPRSGAGRWRLVVNHPSGSLEAAVASARRRNLAISTSILGVLAASMVLLVAATRRSQELVRQQMEFVAAVSHELRTPLAVIRSAGDNLADGVVQEEAQIRRYGALVRSEGRRLTGMVEQILELAGIFSGQRAFEAEPVSIRRVVDDVLHSSAALIDAAQIRVDVEIPDGLPAVSGDETALRRAFQNLVGNAIKYGAAGGWIGIAARSRGRAVEVTVSDRGIGIAPADQQRIFDPFYRAADVVAAQFQGAGLGLSLVRRIVEAHGGHVDVSSVKGQGSGFTVHLPAMDGRAAGERAASAPRALSSGSQQGSAAAPTQAT